jgi:hypothetical protein
LRVEKRRVAPPFTWRSPKKELAAFRQNLILFGFITSRLVH